MSEQDRSGDPTAVDTPTADDTTQMPGAMDDGPPTELATPAEPPSEPPATGEPPSEPPDRRPWLIIGLLIVLLLIGLALLFLDDDEDSADVTSTTTSSTTTTAAPSSTTTTAAPSSSTTTTAPLTTIDPARCVSSEPDDPDITSEVVFDAYTVGDRDCASNLMTADALDQLFGIPGAGDGWTFMGCEEVEDPEQEPTVCTYGFEGGSTTFRMQYDAGWVVFDVTTG